MLLCGNETHVNPKCDIIPWKWVLQNGCTIINLKNWKNPVQIKGFPIQVDTYERCISVISVQFILSYKSV